MKNLGKPKRTILMFFFSVVFFLAAAFATQYLCYGFPTMFLNPKWNGPIEWRRGFFYYFPYAVLLSTFFCWAIQGNFKGYVKMTGIFVGISLFVRLILDKIYVNVIQAESLHDFLEAYYIKQLEDVLFISFQFFLLFIILGKRKVCIKRKTVVHWATLLLFVAVAIAILYYILSSSYLTTLFVEGQKQIQVGEDQLERIKLGMQLALLDCNTETLFIFSVCLFWLFERLTINENNLEDLYYKL